MASSGALLKEAWKSKRNTLFKNFDNYHIYVFHINDNITRKKYQQEFFSAKCFAPDCHAKFLAVDVIMHIGYGIEGVHLRYHANQIYIKTEYDPNCPV